MARSLPEDVVREILLRLDDDVATLFRCAATCKGWGRLVAEPSLLLQRRRWPRSIVMGYFTQRCVDVMAATDSDSQLAFVPFPGPSLLGTTRRPVSTFVDAHAHDAAVVDRAVPLATRGGLLVVRLYPHDGDDDPQPNVVRLVVCDPLGGTWDVLPDLVCNTQLTCTDDYSCDIILPSSAGHGGRPTAPALRVVMIGTDKAKTQFNLHTFVSGEASWRAPARCIDMVESQVSYMEHDEAIVCRGYAHWLFVSTCNIFHILNLNIETGYVSLTKLLGPTKGGWPLSTRANGMLTLGDLTCGNRLATTPDGTLLSLCVYGGYRLEIWTQQQDDGYRSGDGEAQWRCTRVIDDTLAELIQQLVLPWCIWSGQRSGTLLIKDDEDQRIYNACLDTETLIEVTSQFHDHAHSTILPVEVDWPAFFMLRLAGLP